MDPDDDRSPREMLEQSGVHINADGSAESGQRLTPFEVQTLAGSAANTKEDD